MQRRSSSYMDDLLRQQSILDSPTSELSIHSEDMVLPLDDDNSLQTDTMTRVISLGRAQTIYTNDRYLQQRRRILSWPQKIFRWLYSFSLVIFIVLLLAFISVTPLDVIAQTF
ncbi:uncharacterized protein SPAPADRAFT_58098, partial [Spathaspora passalidarum NRRL Y-27907]